MDKKLPNYSKPEIWGGIECTINRVNNTFRDQLKDTGHYSRSDDLEAFASLGIRKIRYPVLWEKHQKDPKGEIDWGWTQLQLDKIRTQNIKPIAGLLHHGSGPISTNLLDPGFPEKLACFAKEVGTKFPWIEYYTPVNEPLTTARFSGLYGFWYPHHKNELSFVKMLLNQVKAIILSMRSIREINPQAKLVQTEDLSKIHSTPNISYQAAFENQRCLLTYDLLCGKFNKQHFFWNYFIDLGIPEKELDFFIENNCPPEIMGFNYYVTSERFLDEKIENYASSCHGGNGKDSYADIEAVRAIPLAGLETLLTEAWDRYQLPLAITECHLNCTREEQLRWFNDTWNSCNRLIEKGIPVKAVTAWALLGAYDWNSLLTASDNYYESGVFDIRNDARRPTALAKMISSLAATGEYKHPLLSEKGWWEKSHQPNSTAPLLITGGNGTLGQAFMKICEGRSIPYIALGRRDLDISNELQIRDVIDAYKPWAIINAAGYVRVDEAEINYNKCFSANAMGPQLLAKISREKGIRFVTFSSDLVFDGDKQTPYSEFDKVSPLNVYGQSKAEGEKCIVEENESSLIIRTSAFFGPWDKYNFAHYAITRFKNNQVVSAAEDVIVSPTYVPDLVNSALDLLIDEEEGIWHLCNEGALSWSDFAKDLAALGGHTNIRLESKSWTEMGWKARRPLYSVMQSEKGVQLPPLENALSRFFEDQIF